MKQSSPTILHFRDVVVSPYTHLLDSPRGGRYHQGGPRWPDWSNQLDIRHRAWGRIIDDEPPEVEPTARLTAPVAWGGAIQEHFGHQIAEFTTRLLPALAQYPETRFAFAGRAGVYRWVEEIPAFIRAVFDWYGIAEERIDLIAEPTLVEQLAVAPQAEALDAPGPEPWYLDLLDANVERQFGAVKKAGALYVSRAGQKSRFAGEAYIENAFR